MPNAASESPIRTTTCVKYAPAMTARMAGDEPSRTAQKYPTHTYKYLALSATVRATSLVSDACSPRFRSETMARSLAAQSLMAFSRNSTVLPKTRPTAMRLAPLLPLILSVAPCARLQRSRTTCLARHRPVVCRGKRSAARRTREPSFHSCVVCSHESACAG